MPVPRPVNYYLLLFGSVCENSVDPELSPGSGGIGSVNVSLLLCPFDRISPPQDVTSNGQVYAVMVSSGTVRGRYLLFTYKFRLFTPSLSIEVTDCKQPRTQSEDEKCEKAI